MTVELPLDVVNKVMLYMESPTARIFKQSKYYRTSYPFRKLLEVSKFPRKCKRCIRHEYYKIYFEAFIHSLHAANLSVDLTNPVFALPTDADLDRDEERAL